MKKRIAIVLLAVLLLTSIGLSACQSGGQGSTATTAPANAAVEGK